MKQLGFIALLLNRYSQSLICYDCYDTGPSNERCVKSMNCTGEACLLYEGADLMLTTAFCLLNLPDHYQRRTKTSGSGSGSAECWFEPDGKGKHCVCSQNFCNKLRDRRFLSEGSSNMPLLNATMVERNPLIDYDDNEAVFTLDLEHPDGSEDTVAIDAAKDLVPVGIENYDYEDEDELRVKVKSPPPPATSPPPKQYALPTYTKTTQFIAATRPIPKFYATLESTKPELPAVDIAGFSGIVFADQLLQEIKLNRTALKLASTESLNFVSFTSMLLLGLSFIFQF